MPPNFFSEVGHTVKPAVVTDANNASGIERVGATADGGLDLLLIKQEISEECLATIKSELKEKQGVEFDHAFLGQQIMAHMESEATLKVFEKHASPKFRSLLAEAKETTMAHRAKAQKLIQTVKEPSSKVSK